MCVFFFLCVCQDAGCDDPEASLTNADDAAPKSPPQIDLAPASMPAPAEPEATVLSKLFSMLKEPSETTLVEEFKELCNNDYSLLIEMETLVDFKHFNDVEVDDFERLQIAYGLACSALAPPTSHDAPAVADYASQQGF